MNATAFRGGTKRNPVYGIRVGFANRDEYFQQLVDVADEVIIVVEMDGQAYNFAITAGFWNKCPEFRDRGGPVIREWLRRHHTIQRTKGKPPQVELIPLGDCRFRLLPG